MAGSCFNFIFAYLIYAFILQVGYMEPAWSSKLGAVAETSPAAVAGLPTPVVVAASEAGAGRNLRRASLLRLLTCGSVDDGKSTLIGRLLYDCRAVFADQLAAVEHASKKPSSCLGTPWILSAASSPLGRTVTPKTARRAVSIRSRTLSGRA
jgi:hypothetical protein